MGERCETANMRRPIIFSTKDDDALNENRHEEINDRHSDLVLSHF